MKRTSHRTIFSAIFASIVSLDTHYRIAPVSASSAADALEAARFGPLPPIVFAPGGRLHGVERVAREAYPPGDDESSCACIALRCGSGDGEFAIISGIGAISPFLHRDESHLDSEYVNSAGEGKAAYIPLVMDYDEESDHDAPLAPISIISPSLVVGVGGKGIDSALLLRRASEVSLSMYKSENGGVEWFMSHSLEGISANSHNIPVGGAARVDAKTLVRKLADMAQISTQSLGSKSGRMLSSSLLATGLSEHSNVISLGIWRVDPTGQFWKMDAGAVGRAAINIEAELINKVRLSIKREKQQHSKEEDEKQTAISNADVKSYLSSLTVEEALDVANDCIVNGVIASMKQIDPNLHSNGFLASPLLDKGLRRRLKTAVIRSTPFGATQSSIVELIRR